MNSTSKDSAIFVTKHLNSNNLFVQTEDYTGIVVTQEGKFLGSALGSNVRIFDEKDRTGYYASLRENVKKAIKDFLEKEKPSLSVSPYTGDEEYKGCFFVSSSPNELGRVVNYKTQEHMGFALSSTSKITYKLSSNHPCMNAIEKYLSDKSGSLCENGVTVIHYNSDEQYNHHVFVMIRTLCFVVDSETRQVVGYVQNSAGKVLEKKVDKIFFEGLAFSTDFYSVVDSFLAGKRNPESRMEVLRKHLEPFKEAYIKYFVSKDNHELFYALGNIVSSVDNEVLVEIKKIYPTQSDGKSVMAAMEELFCKN